MFKQTNSKNTTQLVCKLLLIVGLVSCLLVNEALAGKGKGEDIILYNGNIVMRGGKGKGKGGNIVVANSPQSDGGMMPMFWGGMYRRRR